MDLGRLVPITLYSLCSEAGLAFQSKISLILINLYSAKYYFNIVPSTVVPPSAAPRPRVQTPAIPAQTPQNSAELEILQTEYLQNKEYLYNIYEISTEYL